MSKILVAAMFSICAVAFAAAPVAAAPVAVGVTSGKITIKSTLVKRGADDLLPDDNGIDGPNHP